MADVEPPPADQGANEAPQGLPIITQGKKLAIHL